MCRDEFNKVVRPYVREFPIGKQGVGFDRLELDQWADQYIAAHSNPKPGHADPDARNHFLPNLSTESPAPGKLRPKAVDPHARFKGEFERALEMVRGNRKSRSKR
jgi:hypothetical protein